MESKEFRGLFDRIATQNGFVKQFGGLFKESSECIILLDLQKSKYGNYHQLMIKIFIQGLLGNIYIKNKHLTKDTGDVFRGEPSEYKKAFDLDAILSEKQREIEVESLFTSFIIPFVNEALSREGLRNLAKKGAISLLPVVKEGLEKIIDNL